MTLSLFAGMTGQGQLTGISYGGTEPCAPAGVLDTYTGTVTLPGA
ncbi:MAG TPA: hypothetical protein VFM13_02255 [Gaiellaceae bacterium]|nr:hypothetical protein [Gaiellaceae bacterium]